MITTATRKRGSPYTLAHAVGIARTATDIQVEIAFASGVSIGPQTEPWRFMRGGAIKTCVQSYRLRVGSEALTCRLNPLVAY